MRSGGLEASSLAMPLGGTLHGCAIPMFGSALCCALCRWAHRTLAVVKFVRCRQNWIVSIEPASSSSSDLCHHCRICVSIIDSKPLPSSSIFPQLDELDTTDLNRNDILAQKAKKRFCQCRDHPRVFKELTISEEEAELLCLEVDGIKIRHIECHIPIKKW